MALTIPIIRPISGLISSLLHTVIETNLASSSQLLQMDFPTGKGSEYADSSLSIKNSKLAVILKEINQNVQSMLRLIQVSESSDSTEKLLCLYQSLGVTYNDLNQELLNSLLKFDTKLSCSDQNNASYLATPMAHLSSFKSDISHSHEHQVVSSGSSEMLQNVKLNGEAERNQSGFLIADIFCAELETARRELEARKIDIETEKRMVLELESKLSDSSSKIEILESELEVIKELLEVSEAEVSMLSEVKLEKATMQTDNAELLDNLRAELRSRDIQIEQMEEYLNEVCVKDTELIFESGTDKNVDEDELRVRVEELEKQVELQRKMISEREEEKREAIRELCFSLDYYKTRYIELVRSFSG